MNMQVSIDRLIDGIIKREGGYVDHVADRGGPTNWGITEKVARANGYTGDMRTLPEAAARAIYRRQYWTAPGFDQVATLSSVLAEELLDTGVNMGPNAAGQYLQRALNVLNQEAKLFPDLKVDGNIGPGTLGALRTYLAKRGHEGERVLLTAVNCLQGAGYIEIAEKRPSQESFVFGWLRERVVLVP